MAKGSNRSSGNDADFLPYIAGTGTLRARAGSPEATTLAKFELVSHHEAGLNANDALQTRVKDKDGVRTEHRDGSVYTQKKNNNGSMDHIGSGKAPADNYHVREAADGSYKVLDARGKEVLRSTDPEVAKERRRLDTLSGKFTNPEDKARFRADMARLEARMQKNPQEVAETYSQVASLLEQRGGAKVKPEAIDRLAQDIMSHAGTPKSVDQGSHPTCNVSSMESVIYHDNPSIAAKAIKDLALTGEHKVASGDAVKIDEQSMQPFSLDRRADGERSLSSQYMNVLMVNAALAPRGEHYTSSDQRIKDGQPPEVVGKAPGLSLAEIAKSYKLIVGDKAKPIVIIAHESAAEKDANGKIIPADGVAYYKDQQEYQQLLQRLKQNQGLPVAAQIDVRNNFNPPGRTCAAADDETYSSHLLDIDDIENGKVAINNQWGSRCDYDLPVKQSYEASIDKELSIMDRIAKAKENGTRDFAAEIAHSHTLLRQLDHVPGYHVSSADAMSNLESFMRDAEEVTKQGKPESFGREAANEFANLALRMLSLDDRPKLAEKMRASSIFKKYPDIIELIDDIS